MAVMMEPMITNSVAKVPEKPRIISPNVTNINANLMGTSFCMSACEASAKALFINTMPLR